MSTKSKNAKLELNKDTLRQLVDLSTVHGGAGDDPGIIVQVTKNNTGKGGSWVLCCKNA
ncbi:MAG TPA: hypothetical protein VHW23_09920 [Kofleriaceae bacterium]|jgi:hypothetical protein|nr:hypothetical protein [Kofleriaceae bacterium]